SDTHQYAAQKVMGFASLYPSYADTTQIRLRDLAALGARGFVSSFVPSELRGRREDRVLAAPAVSRAICANKNAHEHTGQRETLRPSLRNGFTAYFVLSPENGSFASVATREALPLPDLAPAPRRPNHTTSPYASGTYVSRPSRPSHLTA